MTEGPLLSAQHVVKKFVVHRRGGRPVVAGALDDVSVELWSGRITGVVGESGSGKSTLARILAGFEEPTEGEVLVRGEPRVMTGRGRKGYAAHVQMVFQDPFASLNGQRPVRHNLERALRIHGLARSRRDAEPQVLALLERVRLHPAREFIDKYPHELSGGQRQRVCIARALAVNPQVLLGDEPIAMLDVSMRLDILNLLADLRREGLGMLYITHDLASARYLCDDLNVMYAGRIVESGPAESVIADPQHPYTRLLLDASPDPARARGAADEAAWAAPVGTGEPVSLIEPPPGCRFHPRCPRATAECRTTPPPLAEHEGWSVACVHPLERSGAPAPAPAERRA